MNEDNPGSLHWLTGVFCLLLSIGLAGADYTGYIDIANWLSAIPVGYVFIRTMLYRVIVGANLKALQVHEGMMEFQHQQDIQIDLRDAVTLDRDKMLRSLRADDETAGRA